MRRSWYPLSAAPLFSFFFAPRSALTDFESGAETDDGQEGRGRALAAGLASSPMSRLRNERRNFGWRIAPEHDTGWRDRGSGNREGS